MVKLTQKQFDALIEYINATVEDAKPTSDLYESVQKLRAKEVLTTELLSDGSTETED